MSDTDHAAAIRQEVDRLYWMALIQEPDRDQLYRHADALAKALAEATARADAAYGDGYHQALCDVRRAVASLSGDAGVARLISVQQGKFRPMDDDDAAPSDTAYPEDESGAHRFPFAPGDTDN